MNKNIFLLALLFTASAIFISCDRNDDDDPRNGDDDPTPEIVLTSPDEVTVYADQTTAASTVNFNATGAWTATVSYPPTATASVRSTTPTWVTIDRSSGNAGSNHIINITFTEINFSGEDRIAIITIRSGNTEIVITITQQGVDADNNIPVNPDNPYANLTQSQIVELLIASNVRTNAAPEFKATLDGGDFNNTSIEVNRNQRRALTRNPVTVADGGGTETTIFVYVEDLTEYKYSVERGKIRHQLDDDFWEQQRSILWRDTDHFAEFTWAVSGRTFTGVSNGGALIITLDENEMFSSVKIGETVENIIMVATFTFGNINPTFPEGFNREDFRSENEIDEGVVINGIRWATRNVDAPGTFAANPEDFGMFYQWNRRVGWSSTDSLVNSNGGTVWDSSHPTGTRWYRENDPCPTGWRVPSEEESQSLRNAGSVWTHQDGVWGRLFGVAPNQIFLPASGRRGGSNGVLGNVGTSGYLWVYNSALNIGNAWFWRFSSGAYGVGEFVRSSGLSIRCVEDITH